MHRAWTSFLAGCVVTAACLLAAPACPAGDASPLVEKGRTLLAKRDYRGAKAAFLDAVAKDPKDVEARRGASEALLGLGETDAAVQQAYDGLDLVENKDGGLWLLAARAFLLKGETLPAGHAEVASSLSDAKAKAGLALQNDPSLNDARCVMAKACRLAGDLERAGRVLEEGLAKEPKDFDLLFEKGMTNLKAGLHQTALEAFAAAAESDPASAEARFQQGNAHAWLRQNEEACSCYVRAAVLDPSNRKYLVSLAKQAGKDDAAKIRWLREVLKQKPDHAWVHGYVAYYQAAGRDEAGALESSRKAMSLEKENPDLVAWHGQILDMLGKAEEARAWYRKAMEKGASLAIAFDKLYQFALDPRSPATAKERRELIPFLAKRKANDPFFWNDVGFLYRETKEYGESIKGYVRAAELAPNDQAIQNDTGLVYLYHGKQCGEDPRRSLPYFLRTLALVDEGGQPPTIGYRDALQNLARYYHEVEPDPEKCIEYADRRNDPEFYGSLPPPLNVPCAPAAGDKQWAEGQLKRR